MCFGSKSKSDGEPAPRPATSQDPVSRSSIDKRAKKTSISQPSKGPSQPVYTQQPSDNGAGPSQPVYAQEPSKTHDGPSQPVYAPPSDYASVPPPMPPPPPPSGAPPSYDDANPGHDWKAAVPDTSFFPPPPAIFSGYDQSPTSNASEEEAIAGEEWCTQYPFTAPMQLTDETRGALHFHNIRLMEPVGFPGQLTWLGQGRWAASSRRNAPDRCLISYPPLYSVQEHSPLHTGRPRTIYYEVKLLPDSPTVYVAMGFTALPYPSFRMPGWHRGSLAVHGDDGHKYINDRWGGQEFTRAFRQGETYGLGMTVRGPAAGGEPAQMVVDIFFTRNGELQGGWNLYEETDAEQDLPVTGLEGLNDLCAAVGLYDGVNAEVIFDPSLWLYKEVS